MAKRKVKVVQVAISHAPAGTGGKDGRTHVAVVDDRGRLFERFSDMPLGQWGEIEAPIVEETQGKVRGRKR